MNKANEEGWNYTGPVFVPVAGDKAINLQDIQMDAACPDQGAEISVRDAGESQIEDYYWFQKVNGKAGPTELKVDVPEGKNGLWFQMIYQFIEFSPEEIEENKKYGVFDDGFEDFDHWEFTEEKTFDYGNGYVLNSSSADYVMTTSGEVTDEDLCYPNLVEGWNFFINPYPASVQLQDFQMDAACPDQGAEISVRDAGESQIEDYYWFQKVNGKAGPTELKVDVPEGKNGLWFKMVYQFIEFSPEEIEENKKYGVFDDGFEDFDHWEYVADKTFGAGVGFALNSSSEDYSLTIVAPYDL